MKNFTLSYTQSVKIKKGTKLTSITEDNLDFLIELSKGKTKLNQPALSCYEGSRSVYSPSNVFFIDIDTNEFTDKVISNRIDIFTTINNIIAIQESFSGNLHIICGLNDKQETEEEWMEATLTASIAVLHLLKTKFSIDIFSAVNEKGKAAFDTHNLSWEQLFYISSNEIYYNDYFDRVRYSDKDIDSLKSTYSEYFPKKEEFIPKSEYSIVFKKDNLEELDTNKLTIDRNFTVGEYSGNDLRWRIGSCLINILGSKEAALDFIKRHFNNVKEMSTIYDKGVNRTVYNWLINTFFNIKHTADTLIVKTYLSEEYKDYIIEQYEEHKRILISSPTGTGKTNLAIALAKLYKAVILVPFNSMLNLYSKDKDIIEVSTSSNEKYTEEKAVVMLWDQAMKYDLRNRLVISDETHLWFADRDYRRSAVLTLNAAKSWKNLICISATPSGEVEDLNLHVLKFYKERDMINVKFAITLQPDVLMNECIKHRTNKVVVFTNRFAKRLWENNPEACLLHSINRNKEEFKEVISTELLNNDITICTELAYNGLNFKNTGKYTVVVDIKEGEDTAKSIIQATGRLRKADIESVIVVFSPIKEDSEKLTIEQKTLDANIIKEFVESNEGKDLPIYFDERLVDKQWVEALTELEKYNILHSTKQEIINDLFNTGYLKVKDYVVKFDKTRSRLELEIKKESSKAFKNMIRINDFTDMDEYQRTWKKIMDNISENVKFSWVDFVNAYKDDKLMDTLIDDVNLIINVTKLSDYEFKTTYDYDKLKELAKMGLSKNKYSAIKKKFDSAWSIREKWAIEKDTETDNIIDEFFKDFIDSEKDRREIGILKKKEAGKKTSKISIIDTTTNTTYDFTSKGECMEFLNISSRTFSKFLKGASKLNKTYKIQK